MPSIPPPPPYPPPPTPSGGGRGAVAPPFPANSVLAGAGIHDGHRHLSDDGSLPSGGSKCQYYNYWVYSRCTKYDRAYPMQKLENI